MVSEVHAERFGNVTSCCVVTPLADDCTVALTRDMDYIYTEGSTKERKEVAPRQSPKKRRNVVVVSIN